MIGTDENSGPARLLTLRPTRKASIAVALALVTGVAGAATVIGEMEPGDRSDKSRREHRSHASDLHRPCAKGEAGCCRHSGARREPGCS